MSRNIPKLQLHMFSGKKNMVKRTSPAFEEMLLIHVYTAEGLPSSQQICVERSSWSASKGSQGMN